MADDAWSMPKHTLEFDEVGQPTNWPTVAIAWYISMCVLALINLALFFVVHNVLLANRGNHAEAAWTRCDGEEGEGGNARPRKMMRCAGLTVLLVFAYRTFFLVSTMNRFAWHDSFLSCVLFVKILTYIAEQAFCGMIIYTMTVIVAALANGAMKTYTHISAIIFYAAMILAQVFSFMALVLKSWYWMIIMTWCWLLGFLAIAPVPFYIVVAACRDSRDRGGSLCSNCWGPEGLSRSAELFGLIMVIFLVLYLPWCCFQELPITYSRWAKQYDQNSSDLNFLQGLLDALTFRVHTKDWEIWKTVVWWHTACNTLGSWVAIFLSTTPRIPEKTRGLIG